MKLDSLLVDKHLFHNLLMKYSDWSLTSEKIGSENKEHTITDDRELNYDDNVSGDNDNKQHNIPLTSPSHTKWPIVVNLLDNDKIRRPKDRNFVHEDLDQDTGYTQRDTINEKDNEYHTIKPTYNSKNKVYEVTIPEHRDTSSPESINVYTDKNIKNDEYNVKIIKENKSYTQERRKSNPEDQNVSLKDFVKDHKISEIIDILFNDENVSYKKPILYCNGSDADILNSDVKHSYSSGDLAEYHNDVNGYSKNVDIDKTILNSVSKQISQDPQIIKTSDTYVITNTADKTVDLSGVKENSDGVSNNFNNLNAKPTISSLPSDKLTYINISKEHNILTLPSTEAKNTESIEYIPCKYSHNKNLNKVLCEYDDKSLSRSNIQDILQLTPINEIHTQDVALCQNDVNHYTPDNSKIVQRLTTPSINESQLLSNPEDYPMRPQTVYRETVPIEDTEFYNNVKISEYPTICSYTDKNAFQIVQNEELTKPSFHNGIPPMVDYDLEMLVSELSQRPQPVSIITFPHIVVEPLSDSQTPKTMELMPVTQISPKLELKPNYEVLHTSPFLSGTTSTGRTPCVKPFIKMSQSSMPQEDTSLVSTISFSQSHLPEMIETKKPKVFTPTNPMSSLSESNINFKEKITPCYSSPSIISKTSEPYSISPVLPSILKPFSPFQSSNRQNMSHKLDIPIPSSTMEIIPELLPVRNTTISATIPNLKPMFTPLKIVNAQTNTYRGVTKAVPIIIPIPGKEPLTICPLLDHQIKPVYHVEEPYVDFSSTVPVQTNYLSNLNLSPATPASHISLLPSIASSATVSPLNYNNQVPIETSEATTSAATNKLLRTHKHRQPTLYPTLSVPTRTSATSFYVGSPYIPAPSIFWQSIPEMQHLISKPSKSPLPKISTVTPSIIHSLPLPIYSNLPEITQFTEQPITYISKPNTYKPSFDKQYHHIPSSTDFLPPITQDCSKLSHPTAKSSRNSQSQHQLPIIKTMPTNNIVSNVTTHSQQSIEPYVESHIANQRTKTSSWISPSSKTIPLIDKILPAASLNVLDPQIFSNTNQLPEAETLLSLTYPQLITPFTNKLRPILSYKDIKNDLQVKSSTVPSILPTTANVTPLTSNQAIDFPYSSNSLYSFFEPISSLLSLPSAKSTTKANPVEIMPVIISQLPMSVKDSQLTDASSTTLPNPADFSITPHLSPFQEYFQTSEPNLFKSYAPYMAQFKAEQPIRPMHSSTTLLPYLSPVKPVSGTAIPLAKDNLPNQPAISNTLSSFPLPHSNAYATPLLDSDTHSCVLSTAPVEKTKSPIFSTTRTTPLVSLALPTPPTAHYTSSILCKGNRQSVSHLLCSEFLPICNKPQTYSPQPASPVLTTPITKEESPSLSSESSTITHIPTPVTAPVYSTSLCGTFSPDKVIPPLSYTRHPPTSPYTYKALPSLLSTISMADIKPTDTLRYKQSESLNFMTPLNYAHSVFSNIPNVQKPNDSFDFQEILPCKYEDFSQKVSALLSPVSYYRSSEKAPKVKSVWFTPNLASNKIYTSTSVSPVKTITEAEISLAGKNIPIQTETHAIPTPSLLSYTSPLLKSTPFSTTVSTAFSCPLLEETTSPAIPSPLLTQDGKLIPALRPLEYVPLLSPFTYGSELIQEVAQSIPLKPSTLTSSNFFQPKGIVSIQQFPSTKIQEALPIYLPTPSPTFASCVSDSIPEDLKPLKLSNVDPPKWRWSDISSSPTPITYMTHVPLQSKVMASNLINRLEALPVDGVPVPVYTESQSFYNTLSIPILAASPVESVEHLLKASAINKPKYTHSKSFSTLPQPVLDESEYIPQLISPLQPPEMLNKAIEVKQFPIIDKYTSNFPIPLSQAVSTSPIGTNVPTLLSIPATPLPLLHRRPQNSRPYQWFSHSVPQAIIPTFATLSKGTKPAMKPSYYPISETIPATSTSSPMLPHTPVNKSLKVLSTFSGHNSNAANLQTPTIPLTFYPTSGLSHSKSKPISNSNLASYFPMTKSTETLNPELSTKHYPVNALESNSPVKLLPNSDYQLPCFHLTPISSLTHAFTPVSNPVQSSSLSAPIHTAPLKDGESIFLPMLKLPASVPYLKPMPFVSSLKQSSQYVTPLQSTYSLQSISDSLPQTLPVSIQSLPASDFQPISSPNFSKSSPCTYEALNIPEYFPSMTASLNTSLSEQKLYEYKPTPHFVSDASNPIPSFIKFSSVSSIKPLLLDSTVTSNSISSHTPLSQTVGPESSQTSSVKPLFSNNAIPLQYIPLKIANLVPNLPTTSVPPVGISYSVISDTNLLAPPGSSVSPLLPGINTPININITARQPLSIFIRGTPYLQSKWLALSPLQLNKGLPILPTILSTRVKTSLPILNTILDPQKLVRPSVTPVSSYLPMPTSNSQTNPGRYLDTTPCDPIDSSPVKSPVSYAPIKFSNPYSQFYKPNSQKPFIEYSLPLKYHSDYPSTCSLRSNIFFPNSHTHYFSTTPFSSSSVSNQPVFIPTQTVLPNKYIFPIKHGQFGLIHPASQSKPYTDASPIISNVVAASITTTDHKPFTNYMQTNSIAPSSKSTMSAMSSTPSELLAVSINPVLPEASTEISNGYTEQILSKLPSPDVKLKCCNNYITPIVSSLHKTSSTSKSLPFSSKLNSLMHSELIYPQCLSMRAPDVLPKYTSPPIISLPLEQSSYSSIYTDTNQNTDPDIVSDSNTPLPAFKSIPHAYPSSLSSIPMTYPSYCSLANNTNDFTPIEPLIPEVFPTLPKSKIALNSNIALRPIEVSVPLRNTQFIPLTSAEYMNPEPVTLKTAINVMSPLSYSQPSSPKTLTPLAQYVTPLSLAISSELQSSSPPFLLKPICSKFSSSQYRPITIPISSYFTSMRVEPTHYSVYSPLTYTPNCKSELSALSQSSIPSFPLKSVSPVPMQEPSITSKNFSSLPPVQSSQILYPSSSSEYETMLFTKPEHTIQNPTPINDYLPSSTGKKSSGPLELTPSIETLPTSSSLQFPINIPSSSKLPNYHTFQSLFKPNSPPNLPPSSENQIVYDTCSYLRNLKSNKDNQNLPIDVEPYCYFPNTYKTNEKSTPYKTVTYPTSCSEPSSVVSKQPTSDTDSFNDSLFNTYPSQPDYTFGKPISSPSLNQLCDNNLSTVSMANKLLPLQKEMNSKLYNYLKNNDNIKANIHNSNVDVSIPVGNILFAKKDCIEPIVYTINPSVGVKMWPSDLKLLEAKLELKFQDVSVINFQPVVNDLATHDVDEVVNLIKNYIQNKYGEVIVLDNNNYLKNKYEVIKHCGSINNKCNLLWPVDTSCHSTKPILKYKGFA